jgi:hypothetical protein
MEGAAGAVLEAATGAVAKSVAPAAVATVEGATVGAGAAVVAPVVAEAGAVSAEAAVAQTSVTGVEAAVNPVAGVAGNVVDNAGESITGEALAKAMEELGRVAGNASEAGASKTDPIDAFVSVRTLSRGENIPKEDRGVPKEARESSIYRGLVEDAIKAGNDPEDEKVQREILDRYYYRQAQSHLKENNGGINREIYVSEIFAVARTAANMLNELRRERGEEAVDQNEVMRQALAIYLEMYDRKKKGKGLMQAVVGAIAGIVKEGFATSTAPVREELTAQPRRR